MIKDRFLGAVELLNEKDSGKLIGMIPTDFNKSCVPVMREQLDIYMFEQNLLFNEIFFGAPANAAEHQAEIEEARKSMIDHRQQSFFKMTFDGKSCESQLARFYNLAGGMGLDVTFDIAQPPEEAQSPYTPEAGTLGDELNTAPTPISRITPMMKAVPRQEF